MRRLLYFVLSVGSTIGVVYFVVALMIGSQVYKDNRQLADAVVVLGTKVLDDGRPNTCLEARVLHGVGLYRQGYGKKMILTGGEDAESGLVEAEEMKRIAGEHGVPDEMIILEPYSTSTYENLVNTKHLLETTGISSVVIVTEAFHSPRAGMVAKALEINYSVSPTRESLCWDQGKFMSGYFLREPLAVMWYKIMGRI